TDATVPPDLQRVHVEILVAGRDFKESFAPAPNLVHTFVWDGKDAYGRALTGAQRVTVRVRFQYPAKYYATADNFGGSFNRFAVPPIVTARGGGGGGGGGGAVTFTLLPARGTTPPIIMYQEYETWVGLGALDARAQALGGWTLSPHHLYDVIGKIL